MSPYSFASSVFVGKYGLGGAKQVSADAVVEASVAIVTRTASWRGSVFIERIPLDNLENGSVVANVATKISQVE